MAKHPPHINEIDRTYQGRCESVAVKSVWEEGSDAIKAFAKEVKNKPKKDLPVQDVVEVFLSRSGLSDCFRKRRFFRDSRGC